MTAAGAGGSGDDGDGGGGRRGGGRRSTPRGRPGRRRGRGRRRRRVNVSPSPWTPPRPSQQATLRGSWTPGRSPRTLNEADLRRRLQMLFQDQEQLAQGREIANVTMTSIIVTSYKQGGPPTIRSTSSRLST